MTQLKIKHKAPRILIFTCSHGSGHRMIAATLEKEFRANGCNVLVFDIFKEFSGVVNFLFEKAYLLSYGPGSKIYKNLYYHSEHKIEKDYDKKEWYWNFFEQTILDIIEDYDPDLILNTYSYRIVPILKNEHFPEIPVCSIITEFTTPDFWIHPSTDQYFIACEEGIEKLCAHGIPKEHITVSGIPVRPCFYETQDKEKLLFKYGLNPNKKTIIIFAGTYGVLHKLDDICKGLDVTKGLQTIVVCGNNSKLRHQLKAQNYKHVKIMGYVSEIQEIFCVGDILVTKPGGTVLSEVVASKIPVILYNPVPGQELENALLFEKRGAALIAKTPEQVFYHVIHLKSYDPQYDSMMEALHEMDRGHSAQTIRHKVLELLGKFHQDTSLRAW